MSIPTVAGAWEEFSSRVLHPNSPPIQRIEMRRAFYAGYYSNIIACVEIADQVQDDDAAVAEYQKLDDECRAFAEAVGRGEA